MVDFRQSGMKERKLGGSLPNPLSEDPISYCRGFLLIDIVDEFAKKMTRNMSSSL